MKAILIGALAASAFAADTVLVNGNYKVAGVTGANCCVPAGDVVVADGTTAGNKKVSFTFAATGTSCPAVVSGGSSTPNDAAGVAVTGEAAPDANNKVTITQKIPASTGTDRTFGLTIPKNGVDDFVLDVTSAASVAGTCTVTLQKAPTTVPPTYSGTYEVQTTKAGTNAAQCCYPTGDIFIRQNGAAGTAVTANWKYAAAGTDCPATGTGAALAGTSVTASGTPNSATGSVPLTAGSESYGLTYAPNIQTDSGVLLQLQGGVNPNDCAISIKQKVLPEVKSTAGVYEVDSGANSDDKCCYPAGDITVKADGSNYNVEWTFGEEAGCPATLKGKKISEKTSTDVATKDLLFTPSGTSYVFKLDYPATKDGAWGLDLTSINSACSVTLEKKSGYVLGLGSLVALSLSYIMF